MKELLDNLNKLEDYLVNESDLSLQDTCNIVGYMSNIRKQAINYTHSSKELKGKNVLTFDEYLKILFKKIAEGIYESRETGKRYISVSVFDMHQKYIEESL